MIDDKRNAGFFGLGVPQSRDKSQDFTGLASFFETALNDSVRRRATWNERFTHWERSESTTETVAIERGRTTVERILSQNQWLVSEGVRFAPQGSFTNRTNVRNEADIDLRVQHPVLRIEHEPGVNPYVAAGTFGYFDEGRTYSQIATDMRLKIAADLKSALGKQNVDASGKKAIRIKGVSGSRGEVDVVACFTLHHVYVPTGEWAYNRVEGVAILGTDGAWTFNYPDQHIANGRRKRTTTRHQFKRMVRIIKRMQADMSGHGVITERVPSFLVECLVYLVEDQHFLYSEDRYDRVKRILRRSLEIVSQDGPVLYSLREINGIKPLFGVQAWTVEKARRFLASAISHLGTC
ncbi:hypothetical protein [Sinorhizobium medicae]|uniref:hypothetical protein n=1 Tax=Sinorhizobium medicae TaxID=110321 RepID=UPI0003678E04|nr:hypothetical protein [Sinorhizobium medicae]RVJ16179.1 hypothetical protein CN179_33120 [Sinorhizobium medicae]UFX03339.1 hypothetical protein SmedWSM1115_06715 [Sinorhizobium medicae WSM1115]